MFVACCPANFSRQFWRWRALRGASFIRTKCRSEAIYYTQILLERLRFHKAILDRQ
jgi:hypothetical protein